MKRIYSNSLLPSLLFLALLPSRLSAGDVSVMCYNLCNYFVEGDGLTPLKQDFSKECIGKTIKAGNPDILIAIEIGREKSYEDFKRLLKRNGLDYPFQRIMEGDDSSRHIALLSRFAPKEFNPRNDLKYKIKAKNSDQHDEIGVQRGLVHAVFEFDGPYRLHVIGAHLKSRVFNSRYNQTDMRRYEARLLRYLVNEILSAEPEANILVMGDLNDTYDSEPIRLLRDDAKRNEMRLYDLRPPDKWNLYWTHWWNQNDAYSRIDYALASHALLPEIDKGSTHIVHVPDLWMFASDHRPILVSVKAENAVLSTSGAIDESYPRLPDAPAEGAGEEDAETGEAGK